MDKLIMCSSVTYAIKGRDLLRAKGLKASIKRPPRGGCGCGYCISVKDDYAVKAINILKEKLDEKNSMSWWLPAEKNLLYIFPSYLYHTVEPNLNKEENRISLSFDISLYDK